MADKNSEINFEESLAELEQLVGKIESDRLPLDQALKAFEQGIKLSRECQTALDQAEQKVSILLGNEEQPFQSASDAPTE
jgi:exodeoxyribonuclease VII small subunit